ncbi:MAG: hypothetical protein R3B99_10060 [Polyangiales bacterium]
MVRELSRGISLLIVLSGCGLSLELSPPDPERTDAGPRADAGMRDANVDANRDAGCRTDLECDDRDACNGLELCVAGACQDGSPVVCPDDDVCDGTHACDPDTGECSIEVAPLTCEGGDVCVGERVCDPVAGCVTRDPIVCDDGIACTVDSCTDGGCSFRPDDGLCDRAAGGTCTAEGCVYEVCDAATCAADNPCQTAACVEGRCVRSAIVCEPGLECCGGECKPIGCDDGNGCTRDFCAPLRGCQHEPAATPNACDDGDPCTTGDRCDGATCRSGPSACTSSNVCLAPFCDAISGACSTAPVDDVRCNDGDPCTVSDTCAGGVCQPGLPVDCSDDDPCTVDACSELGCTHRPAPDGTMCNSGGNRGTCSMGRCIVTSFCALGQSDCDGDGSCECTGTCATNMAGLRVCTTSACGDRCGRGETCCNLVDSRDYELCLSPTMECTGGGCCLVDGI